MKSAIAASIGLIGLALIVVALQGLSWAVPVRPIVVATFIVFAPGFAILRLWDLATGWAEVGLSIAVSVSLATIVAGGLLYLGHWSPYASLLILSGLTVLASLISLLRTGRRALKRPRPPDDGDYAPPARVRPAPVEALPEAATVAMAEVRSPRGPRARPAARRPPRPRVHLGRVSVLVCSTGLGLLACSIADALSRATTTTSPALFWLGVLIIALPIFFRLASDDASTPERFALVCLLGAALYGVKVIRDSPVFTFQGELVHGFTANEVVDHHHLFQPNPILAAIKYYPGLEGASSSLMALTRLSSYTCGTILLGAARLTLMASLFLVFLQISGSGKTAGLATAIYAGNSSFLLADAQYSHEALALTLLALTLMAIAEWKGAARPARRSWDPAIVLAIGATVMTDLLISSALAVTLVALSIATWWLSRSWHVRNPWHFAVLAVALVLAWWFGAAGAMPKSLSQLLTGGGVIPPAPLHGAPEVALIVAAASIALLGVGLILGLRGAWPSLHRRSFFLIFAPAAVGVFATLLLQLVPSARATASQVGQVLFIGLAFVAAYAGVEHWRLGSLHVGRPLLTAGLGVILVGGAIFGWPWETVMPAAIEASAGGGTIASPSLALGRWAARFSPTGRYVALPGDSGLLLDPGYRNAVAAKPGGVFDALTSSTLAPWQVPLLRADQFRYVVVDRRQAAQDPIVGDYFASKDFPAFPNTGKTRFRRFARIYTSGVIAVYDLGEPEPAAPRTRGAR